MKRFLILFAAIFLCFSNANAITKYVTADFLNLRSGPGTEYSIITVLPKGTPVEIDEDCDCHWVWVKYNGYTGCISSYYISSQKPSYCYVTAGTKSSSSHSYTSTKSNSKPCSNISKTATSRSSRPPPKTPISTSTTPSSPAPRSLSSSPSPPRR